MDESRRQNPSRRDFLKLSGSVAALGGVGATLTAFARSPAAGPEAAGPYGELLPAVDRTTGLALLKLPRGFRYASWGWTGDPMSDGTPTPERHDGMAVVTVGRGRTKEIVLVRNHERGAIPEGAPLPVIGAGKAPLYDGFRLPGELGGLGGGTTTLTFRGGELVDHRASLGGTLVNCAGGPTPWGSWLTCEEVVIRGSRIGAQDHGYVYEVPGDGTAASARPIKAMGLMKHEAVAVDPRTSHVYLTEDNEGHSGFYRFRPADESSRVGALERGGTLEMLTVAGRPNADLRDVRTGDAFPVEWVRVADPDADPEGFRAAHGLARIEGRGRSGPYLHGEEAGGARFDRGEGCWYANGIVYFADTTGGSAGKGSVFAYDPAAQTLHVLFVSPDAVTADNPDNLTVSPAGGLLVCEDNGGIRNWPGAIETGTRLIGIAPDGGSWVFAENNMIIDSALPDRPGIEPGDYRGQEWCGACFDPSGKTLFVNIQTPGVTFAITGPWDRGPL